MDESKPQGKPEKGKLLTLEEILPGKRTQRIYLPIRKGEVEIQNITYGDLGAIYKQAKDDAFEFGMGVILKGLINPKIEWSKIGQLDPQDATLLVTEIMELSGYTPKAAEVAKKYLRPT